MAGTKLGGQKAAATNRAKYGSDFYRRIGSLPAEGKGSPKGMFGHGLVDPRAAGAKGGRISRRGAFEPITIVDVKPKKRSLMRFLGVQ